MILTHKTIKGNNILITFMDKRCLGPKVMDMFEYISVFIATKQEMDELSVLASFSHK